MAAVTGWPGIGTRSWLRLPLFAERLNTRIENLEGERVEVGIPFGPSGDTIPTPETGEEFFLGWTIEQQAYEVPLQLVSVQAQAFIPTWTCVAIGPIVEVQRRSFVRVDMELTVNLEMGRGPAAKCKTIDLSEGGMRVKMGTWITDPGLRQFDADLPLPTGEIPVIAQVVWWGDVGPDGMRTVGIRFVDCEPKTADLIRRHVFATQLDQRRRARES